MGVAYANCICHVTSNKLTYLLTYLFDCCQHYDADVDVMCNLPFAYSRACCNSPTEPGRLLRHLFYFILLQHLFYFYSIDYRGQIAAWLIALVRKKGATLFSTITLANLNRYLQFLYRWKQE